MDKRERIREIILQLKTIKRDLDLTNQDILEMVEKSGRSTSMTTLHRLFSEGSENKDFNFRATIQPIFNVMTEAEKSRKVADIDDNVLQAQFDALKQESLLKDTIIKDLQEVIDKEKRKVDHLLEEVTLMRRMMRKLLGDEE